MKIRGSGFKIAFAIALVHCVIGNIIGISFIDSILLEILFFPYVFISGLSQFAGWDWLSLILEILSLFLMTAFFYPIGMLLERKK